VSKNPVILGRQGHVGIRMAFKLIQIGAEKVKYISEKSYVDMWCPAPRSRIHERTISLRFLGIILRVLEDCVNKV